MRSSVIVVDDFYADPVAVRNYALAQSWHYPYQRDKEVASGQARVTWMTTSFREAGNCPFKSSKALITTLEALIGEQIDLHHWRLGFPITEEGKPDLLYTKSPRSCLWNCSFHFKSSHGQLLGQGVHNHVTDTWNRVGKDGWAGIIYLSQGGPLSGGLKLWRHHDASRQLEWMTPKENWELIDDLGHIFNRLLLCRGDMPHSGADGWGSTPADGRLFQTFFFRVKPQPARPGAQILGET